MQKRMNDLVFRLMSLEFRIKARFADIGGLLEEAGVGSGMTVLDFGCGPGRYTIPAAELVGASGSVVAADLHPLAIKAVERTCRRRRIGNVRSLLTDGALPLEDGSVDEVLLFDTLHDVEDRRRVVGELLRVLREGGTLAYRDHSLAPESAFGGEIAAGLLVVERRNGAGLACLRRATGSAGES